MFLLLLQNKPFMRRIFKVVSFFIISKNPTQNFNKQNNKTISYKKLKKT